MALSLLCERENIYFILLGVNIIKVILRLYNAEGQSFLQSLHSFSQFGEDVHLHVSHVGEGTERKRDMFTLQPSQLNSDLFSQIQSICSHSC